MSLGLVRRLATLGVLALLLSSLAACEGRHPAPRRESQPNKNDVTDSTVVEFDLTQGVAEATAGGGFFPLPAARTFTGLIRAVERVRADRNTKAVYIRLGSAQLASAKVEELALLLGSLKQKTPIYCHAHSLSNATLWLTLRGCTKTWLSPAGDVNAIGIAAQLVYFKGLLDKLQIQADFLSVGKYKSAAESLLRDAPSDAAREEWLETLGSLRTSWLEGIGSVRPDVLPHLETGPWGARAALERKLVSALGDEHEARRDTTRQAGTTGTKVVFGAGKKPGPGQAVQEILKLLSGVDADASGKPHIAVVPFVGSITMGASDGLLQSDGISEHGAARTIQRLIDDDAVRAVVLRIDSPGGSALASDLIWSRLRELGRAKPLIASVGGMAASGGYYLACAADRIVAESTSIVGSIGVVGGKIVFGPALEPYGIHTVTLTPGPDANRVAYESPLVAWDDGTRERVREQMHQVYDLFVDRVAEGRKMQRERVLESAEGRIFSGRQGRERGLVDALGGLTDALAWARKEAGLDAEAPVTVEGQGEGLLASLGLDAEASAEQFAASVERRQQRLYGPYAALPKAWVPWVSGLSPLLEQERVLTLMPFVLQVP